jgi:hypothetical protein
MAARAYNQAGTGNLGPIGGRGSGTYLDGISINTTATSATLKVYDGQDATSGKLLGTWDCSSTPRYIDLDVVCLNGVFAVVAGGAADVTICVGG